MVVPTTLYCIIITVMVVVASGMYAGGGFLLQHRNLLIGAILFYISDITVARDRLESDLLVPEFNSHLSKCI